MFTDFLKGEAKRALKGFILMSLTKEIKFLSIFIFLNLTMALLLAIAISFLIYGVIYFFTYEFSVIYNEWVLSAIGLFCVLASVEYSLFIILKNKIEEWKETYSLMHPQDDFLAPFIDELNKEQNRYREERIKRKQTQQSPLTDSSIYD